MSYTIKQIAAKAGMTYQVTANLLRHDVNAPEPLDLDEFEDEDRNQPQGGRKPNLYDETEIDDWLERYVVKKKPIVHEVPTSALVRQFLDRPTAKNI